MSTDRNSVNQVDEKKQSMLAQGQNPYQNNNSPNFRQSVKSDKNSQSKTQPIVTKKMSIVEEKKVQKQEIVPIGQPPNHNEYYQNQNMPPQMNQPYNNVPYNNGPYNNPPYNNQGYNPNVYQNQGQMPYGYPNQNGYQQNPNQRPPVVNVISGPMDPRFCKVCNSLTESRIQYKAGVGTWLICLGLFFIGLCLCSWIPFCVQDTQDKTFYCVNCANMKGQKKLVGSSN